MCSLTGIFTFAVYGVCLKHTRPQKRKAHDQRDRGLRESNSSGLYRTNAVRFS